MRRWLVILALLCLLAGCSGSSAPERVTADFLQRLSKGKISQAEKLTVSRDLGLDKGGSSLYKPLFESIRFSVEGVVIEGEVATISLTLRIIDLNGLMEEASLEALQEVLSSGAKKNSDLYYGLLLEKMTEEDPPVSTHQTTVRLVKEGRRWRIDLKGSSGFCKAIGGGVSDLIGG